MAVLGEEALGVELHAVDGQFAVAQAHQFVAVLGPRRGLKHSRQRIVDHQAVVARGGERRRQPGEHAATIMADAAGLAVHQPAGALDHAAESLTDRLVAQAHAQQRHARGGGGGDQGQADARLGRRARARRDHQAVWALGQHLGNGLLIVAVDRHLGAQFPQVLHQVVGETVVIIDHDDHRGGSLPRAKMKQPEALAQLRCISVG